MFGFKKYFQQKIKTEKETDNKEPNNSERQLSFNFRDPSTEKQLNFHFVKDKTPFGAMPYSLIPEEKKAHAMKFLKQLLKMLGEDDPFLNYFTSRNKIDLVKIVNDKDLIPIIKMEISKNKKIRENLIKEIAKELMRKYAHKDIENATRAAELIVKQTVSPKDGLFNSLFKRN